MSQITDILKKLQSPPVAMSQSEIAERTGIPQPRISRWGAGEVPAGAKDALKLLELAREKGVHTEGAV